MPHPRRLIPVAVVASAAALTACGSSNSAGTGGSKAAAVHNQFVAFSVCMRSHGVPNFPDPSNGGIRIGPGTGLNPRSPAFQAAQTACQKLLPGGGPGHARPQDGPRLLKLAQCMRAHGVTSFPDPIPFQGNGPPTGHVLVIDGYEFKLGPGLDPMSPAFQNAMQACGGPGGPGGPKGP
jgi:hypothetical protein